MNFLALSTQTWRFTRKPEWLKDFSPTAKVSQEDAINGLLAAVKPIRAIPGPIKPTDCRLGKKLDAYHIIQKAGPD